MSHSAYLIVAAGGLLMAAAGAVLYWKAGGVGGEVPPKNVEGDVERVTLAEASISWTGKEGEPQVVNLADIAPLWVDTEEDKHPVPRPDFAHDEIADFWVEMVERRTYITGVRKSFIASILKMLDQSGDCPSVVRNPKHKDVENKYTDEVFSLLSTIPLWKHSLEVARNLVQRVNRETLIPDAMIAGLGHDLGKIPAYHDKGYSTGDHPIISAIVLNGFPEFAHLSNAQELDQIVRSHHYVKPHNAIASLLKDCDQIVRNIEISQKLHKAVADEQQKNDLETAANDAPLKAAVSVTAQTPAAELPQPEEDPKMQPDHPLGHKDPENDPEFVLKRAALPWFNPEDLLNGIKEWINVAANGRWGAVSMPDGLVYVNSDCLWGVLKNTAPNEVKADLLTADADEARKRTILHNVVWTLSEERNAVAADMIKPDHYMIPVTIINGSNRLQPGHPLLVPFRAEAFGVLPSDLENTKSPSLRKMVKSIKPRMHAHEP